MDRGGCREPNGCTHLFSVYCNVWAYVSCRGYAGIPQEHSVMAVKQGGTADNVVLFGTYSSLTESIFLSGAFFVYKVLFDERYKARELFLF